MAFKSWFSLALCLTTILSDLTSSSPSKFTHAFHLPQQNSALKSTTRSSRRSSTTTISTNLNYASSDPMAAVDSKKGGCPFLDTTFSTVNTYSIPALYNDGDSRPIVLFDGSCNLCNKVVQMLLKYDSCKDDKRGNLRFAALQSRVGDLLLRRMSEEARASVIDNKNADADGNDNDKDDNESSGDTNNENEKYKSIVICTPSKTYINSSAVLLIGRALGGKLKPLKYLSFLGYAFPTKLRDRMYRFVSRRRRKWFGSANECLLWDDRFEERFVDDGVLTGVFRDPFADPNAEAPPTTTIVSPNLFDSDTPPKRGDKVRVVWPTTANDPSVTFDNEFPSGVCLIGAEGTISTIDLPMRVVMRVDRESIGLEKSDSGEETMIAWAKPSEIATV